MGRLDAIALTSSSGGVGIATKAHPEAYSGNLAGFRVGFYRVADDSSLTADWKNCAVVTFCNRTIESESALNLHDHIIRLLADTVVVVAGLTVPARVANWGSPSHSSDDLWSVFDY